MESSGQSIQAYKRTLFDATLRNIELALTPVESSEPTTTVETVTFPSIQEAENNVTSATPPTMTQNQFTLLVFKKVREAYASKTLTQAQIRTYSFLIGKMGNTTQAKIAEFFNIPVIEVPIDGNALGQFIRDRRDQMTDLQVGLVYILVTFLLL